MKKYDLAISFAGEQRAIANSIARRLDAAGYSVFFDEFEEADLWGQDLSVKLGNVYANDARYCLVLLSKEYLEKAWPNLERQNAISRFMSDHKEYLLCLKIDDVDLPGLPSVIGYLDYSTRSEDDIYSTLLKKLGNPNHIESISTLSQNDRDLSKEIIQACYRRSVFASMTSEIDLASMYSSIGEALGEVQKRIPLIEDQSVQFKALQIVGALDEIERFKTLSDNKYSFNLEPDHSDQIDKLKQKVIRLLSDIRRLARISMHLPSALQTHHFMEQESADAPPAISA